MDLKIEIKEERWWEDETAAVEPQSESTLEFPVLFVNKKEEVSELDEHASLAQTPRLSTEEGSTCTGLIHSDLKKPYKVTLENFKTSNTCTVLGEKVKSISSIRQDSNPTHDFDIHAKNYQSAPELDLKKHSFCHVDTKSYNCEETSTQKSDLDVHRGTRPYQCDSCNKRFKAKGHLKRHIACHLGTKRYKCDSCEKSFIWNSDLKRHILCHSGTKPYKCDRCDSSFLRKSNLERHVLCHSGIKQYKCDSCEKSFICQSDLKRHVLCHPGIKLYKCDRCESSFLRKSNLNRHLCH